MNAIEELPTDEQTTQCDTPNQSRLPAMPGSTDFYELLGKALAEAKAERGKVEIQMDHPTQVRIQVFGSVSKSPRENMGSVKDEFLFRRELTHYL